MAYMGARDAERMAADRVLAAEAAAREAVLGNPRDHAAQQRLCELLLQQNRMAEADVALRKAIIWLPDMPSLRIQLAFVLTRTGDHAAARQVLSQAAAQMPAGSRMQQDVAEPAASFGPPLEPHQRQADHPQPLLLEQEQAAAPLDDINPVLGLDDLTSASVAELVRAGQAALFAAEPDEPDTMSPQHELEWGVPPEKRLDMRAPWLLAGAVAACGTVVFLSAELVAHRVAIMDSHMPRLPWLAPARQPAPAPVQQRVQQRVQRPEPAIAKPKPVEPGLAEPKPAQPRPQAAPTALPEAALPMVTLSYSADDAGARARAETIAAQLRAAGVTVIATHPVPARDATPGVAYVFAEDRAAAEQIRQRHGAEFGPLVARGPSSAGEATPGSIAVTIP